MIPRFNVQKKNNNNNNGALQTQTKWTTSAPRSSLGMTSNNRRFLSTATPVTTLTSKFTSFNLDASTTATSKRSFMSSVLFNCEPKGSSAGSRQPQQQENIAPPPRSQQPETQQQQRGGEQQMRDAENTAQAATQVLQGHQQRRGERTPEELHQIRVEAGKKAAQHRDPEEMKETMQKARDARLGKLHEEKEENMRGPKPPVQDKQQSEQQTDNKGQLSDQSSERASQEAGERVGESTILERGQIYLFYAPMVKHVAPHSVDDIARLFILLAPKNAQRQGELESGQRKYRLLTIGRKKLPASPAPNERYLGFVNRVTNDVRNIFNGSFEKETAIDTKTEKFTEGTKPFAEGVYAIVTHHNHSHIAYVLDLPQQEGEVQRAINLTPEGSFVVQVLNPTKSRGEQHSGLTPDLTAQYPSNLLQEFQNKRYSPLKPDFLDFEGAEIVFTGSHTQVGIPELEKEQRKGAEEERKAAEEERKSTTAEEKRLPDEEAEDFVIQKLSNSQLFDELRLGRGYREPLLQDVWR